MTKNKRPIAVFDSGLGGLTAVRELKRILPFEDIVYFGDTARIPYGTRSEEVIKRFSVQDLKFVLSHSPKAVLVACGTISSVALDYIKGMCPVPISGVVIPTATKAVNVTKNKKILILGTGTTIRSNSYKKIIASLDKSIQTIARACPMFVPMIENGHIDDNVADAIIDDTLKDVRDYHADTVILGCTHYPLIADRLKDYLGDVFVVNSGLEGAIDLAKNIDTESSQTPGKLDLYVSDDTGDFKKMAEYFLQYECSGLNVTDIDNF